MKRLSSALSCTPLFLFLVPCGWTGHAESLLEMLNACDQLLFEMEVSPVSINFSVTFHWKRLWLIPIYQVWGLTFIARKKCYKIVLNVNVCLPACHPHPQPVPCEKPYPIWSSWGRYWKNEHLGKNVESIRPKLFSIRKMPLSPFSFILLHWATWTNWTCWLIIEYTSCTVDEVSPGKYVS